MFGFLLLCVIELMGVRGETLRARAFFDANNVKVGDPLVLTVDFIGAVNFRDLHPPALSRHVDRVDWKVDDVSAKTDTFRDARRLTYRVRPMREGLLWFPPLEFSYLDATGATRVVRANAVPVHAKAGIGVVVAEMALAEDQGKMPSPPALLTDPGVRLSDDLRFAWRKACADPKADAFAAFDFPAAKMNEATCAIREGNWARAVGVYRRLEWRIGQTPEIEKGLVAALALRTDNPAVELPVARQVFRPILRYGWRGRLGIAGGAVVTVVLVFWLLGRGIRALAALAFALVAVLPAKADLFQQMEEQMNQMRRQMNQSMRFSFGGGMFENEERTPPKITASLATDRAELQVGSPFAFVVAIEAPRNVSIGQISMTPSERFGLTVTGPATNLADAPSKNPSNVIKRLSVPVRYDVPFDGSVSFAIQGMVTGRESRRGGMFSFSFSNSFSCETRPIRLAIRPLASAGQPDDFSGLVSEGLRLHETCDLLTVETNDVVTITYRLMPKGYVPVDFMLPDAAFEWNRQTDRDGRVSEIEYRRYFVATGDAATPRVSVPYYDPRTKSYRRVTVGGTRLKYVPERK